MTFYHLQLTILYNTLRALGPFASLLLLSIALFTLYGISYLSPLEIIGICVTMVVGIHVNRGDKSLLQQLYHGQQWHMLMVEYVVMSFPFALVCCLNGHLFCAASCLALSAIVPFMPRVTIGLCPFTYPLLSLGAYQYRNTMRILLVPYLVALVVSIVGLSYKNPNILQVCLLLVVFFVGCLLCQPLHRQYLLPYATPMRIITLQFRYAFISAIVLLLPFVLLRIVYAPTFDAFVDGTKTMLLAALFLYLCECVRYLRLGNDLLNMMMVGALFVLLLVCYMRPVVLALAIVVMLVLSVNVYRSKKNYG